MPVRLPPSLLPTTTNTQTNTQKSQTLPEEHAAQAPQQNAATPTAPSTNSLDKTPIATAVDQYHDQYHKTSPDENEKKLTWRQAVGAALIGATVLTSGNLQATQSALQLLSPTRTEQPAPTNTTKNPLGILLDNRNGKIRTSLLDPNEQPAVTLYLHTAARPNTATLAPGQGIPDGAPTGTTITTIPSTPQTGLMGELSTLQRQVKSRLTPDIKLDGTWQQDRILARAAEFEIQAQRLLGDLPALRQALSKHGVSDSATLELHGVLSHYSAETVQIHTKTFFSNRVFVLDSTNNIVERSDLAQKRRDGKAPIGPAMQRSLNGTATFATAVPLVTNGNTSVNFLIPDLKNLDVAPRAKPIGVGDVVRWQETTGQTRVDVMGQAYVPDQVAVFGRVVAYDGTGKWTIEQMTPDGQVAKQADGSAIRKTLTDDDLRIHNNPTIFRGNVPYFDATFDIQNPLQQKFLAEFQSSPEYQEIIKNRPSVNAPAAHWAAWELKTADAADLWLNSRIFYPLSETEIANAKASLATTPDATLQDKVTRSEEYLRMSNHKDRGETPPNIAAYFYNKTGQCRHQVLMLHVLLQDLGIDSKPIIGPSLDDQGLSRGPHIWFDIILRDGQRMFLDPTWSEQNSYRPFELHRWYHNDKRWIEDPARTTFDFKMYLTNDHTIPSRSEVV